MLEKDDSPIVEVIAEAHSKLEKLLKLYRAFWRTKQAVQDGIPLYTWHADDLHNAGYIGAWKFNVTETVITGGIASITTNLLNFFASTVLKNDALSNVDVVFLLLFENEPIRSDSTFASIFKSINNWTSPFVVPIILTGVVYFVGWGSLYRRDSNLATRQRARHAYLYFDGAYGFFSKLFLAFGAGIFISDITETPINPSSPVGILVLISFAVLLLTSLVQQFLIAYQKIPCLLFTVNGYTTRKKRFWQTSLPKDPPWEKFGLANLFGTILFMFGIPFFLSALSFLLAWFLFWFRGLIV